MKLATLLGCLILLAFTIARANVTITNGAVGIMRDQTGAMIAPGAIGLLVADTLGNGLVDPLGAILGVGNFLGGGGDDQIVGLYQAVDLGTDQIGFDLSGTTFNYSGNFEEGDALWLVWFPSISTPGSTVMAATGYGAFRSDSIDEMGTMAWIAPAEGTNQDLFALDADLGGSPAVSQSAVTANFVTVPEPSVVSLMLSVLLAGQSVRCRLRVN